MKPDHFHSELKIGDTIEIDGTKVIVEKIDEDAFSVAWFDGDGHLRRCQIARPFRFPTCATKPK